VLSVVLPARRVVQATRRARILVLDLADQQFPFAAGQAVIVGLASGDVRRPYSIACAPTQSRRDRMIELLVQIDDHQAPDPHLERVVVGTEVRVEGPMGVFGIPPGMPEQHLLLIAGGTGIAPLRSIMWETLEAQPLVQQTVIYSARAPDEFAYLDELTELAASGRIERHLTVTRESSGAWPGGKGRIDGSLIRAALRTSETRCLVCGPPALVSDAVTLLRKSGVSDAQIGWEAYE
jgi:ferredoxin-NADP reductase